jgi:hypothetical protein
MPYLKRFLFSTECRSRGPLIGPGAAPITTEEHGPLDLLLGRCHAHAKNKGPYGSCSTLFQSVIIVSIMRQTRSLPHMLQFRLSVKDVKPEIWRKLFVSSDITLERLHTILQVLMGWRNTHLYAFVIKNKRYSPPNEVDDFGKRNSIKTRLSSIFAKRIEPFTYEYDFGDGWEIEVQNESRLDGFQQSQPAECIDGSRHGPAEDSGGSRGYMEKAKIYNNPQHRRYQEIHELIGPGFDPEGFDLIRTNEILREIG